MKILRDKYELSPLGMVLLFVGCFIYSALPLIVQLIYKREIFNYFFHNSKYSYWELCTWHIYFIVPALLGFLLHEAINLVLSQASEAYTVANERDKYKDYCKLKNEEISIKDAEIKKLETAKKTIENNYSASVKNIKNKIVSQANEVIAKKDSEIAKLEATIVELQESLRDKGKIIELQATDIGLMRLAANEKQKSIEKKEEEKEEEREEPFV